MCDTAYVTFQIYHTVIVVHCLVPRFFLLGSSSFIFHFKPD